MYTLGLKPFLNSGASSFNAHLVNTNEKRVCLAIYQMRITLIRINGRVKHNIRGNTVSSEYNTTRILVDDYLRIWYRVRMSLLLSRTHT